VISYEALLKDLRAFPKGDVRRIMQRIRSLANVPRRLVVLVVRVGHRRDVCRNT
jgi:hypothetical protein